MPAIERHVTLPTGTEEAWELLTDAQELAHWLGAEVDLRPEPGAAGVVVDRDGTRRRLVVDEVDAGRRLAWHWAEEDADGVGTVSRVEITLAPAGDGTRVRVVEELLEAQPSRPTASASASASAGEAWSHRLLHLEALLLVAAAVRG